MDETSLKKAGFLNPEEFDFKKYIIEYNKVDVIGLYEILCKFFVILVDNFHIDFTHCLTLPQLVMELFRKKYLPKDTQIRLLSRRMHNIIAKAYYGANTSVYIP